LQGFPVGMATPVNRRSHALTRAYRRPVPPGEPSRRTPLYARAFARLVPFGDQVEGVGPFVIPRCDGDHRARRDLEPVQELRVSHLAAEKELAGVERVPDPHEIVGVPESHCLVRPAGRGVAVVAIDEGRGASEAPDAGVARQRRAHAPARPDDA
jgi:hypothetical protein